MDVLIHTSGRATLAQQHTLRALLADNVDVSLIVQAKEAEAYSKIHNKIEVLPAHITTLATTRDFIIHDRKGSDHVVFLDDDLTFAVRRTDDRSKFLPPVVGDLQRMVDTINVRLLRHPMVGIGAREGGNRVVDDFVYNSRIMRVLAFRRPYLQERMLCFHPMVVMEDFHINLQILRSGADTCICNNWVSNQAGGSDAPGGCSVYRTDAVQSDSAHQLAKLHPGFVAVVRKMTKTAWGGKTRTDVTIQWKKARASHAKS